MDETERTNPKQESIMKQESPMKYCKVVVALLIMSTALQAAEFTVAPHGKDSNPGTAEKPFATLQRAQEAVSKDPDRGIKPMTVTIAGGTYYLAKPLIFRDVDNGTKKAPVTWQAKKGAKVIISGGLKLALTWEHFKDGILKAQTPAGLTIDQLFVNGLRRHMARYPNYDKDARPYNGAAADAFAPSRAKNWKDPTGGYIHALHHHHWGGYHFRITGKDSDNNVKYEGGWQNNRPGPMHKKDRFVENIFEELDAPREWYHDAKKNTLYYMPDKDVDVKSAEFVVVGLRHLIEMQGSKIRAVKYINISGLTLRHTARTFMDTKEPLLRSDWTIYRGGAIFINGAEDCTISDCEFDQLGGNSIFVNNYNRRITIKGCHIHGGGASAICFVGDPGAVRNPQYKWGYKKTDYNKMDKTPGPKTDDYPADCLVDNCLIHNMSVVEKQATGVQISMSKGITVRHCSIYDMGRAGINIGDGTFGSHVIEFCDVFDTVRETGDHGSFNSWGRDRYWNSDAPNEKLPEAAKLDTSTTIIRNSRWRCDHGWDVDLDDGSSMYEIYNNVFLRGGLKLREGFHRKVYNNIAVNSSMHPHCWFSNSMDVITGNIWMGAYRPASMRAAIWGKKVDGNLFTTAAARDKFKDKGCDANSLFGDPMFIDPEHGDYRVKESSPALKIGFKNFPMDKFGVQKPELKKIAHTPKFPPVRSPQHLDIIADVSSYWQGAEIKGLKGEEFSAFGVSKEEGGIHLVSVPAGSLAAASGLKEDDVVQTINGKSTGTIRLLLQATDAAKGKPLAIKYSRKQVSKETVLKKYIYVVTETNDKNFNNIKLLPAANMIKIIRLTASSKSRDKPLEVLIDNKLAENYGPVFGNGTKNGVYTAYMKKKASIKEIRTWSFNQGGIRGLQNFKLFGLSSKGTKGIPIAMVYTGKSGKFTATKIVMSDGGALGEFEVLQWRVQSVSAAVEHTAFQEFQLR